MKSIVSRGRCVDNSTTAAWLRQMWVGFLFVVLTPFPEPVAQRLALSDGERVSIAVTTPLASPPALAKPLPPAPEWMFPRTVAERIRYRVFLDLHTRGCAFTMIPQMMSTDAHTSPSSAACRFTLTSGAKFGGDFLAYPGDPALYHAQYTVRCVQHSAPQHPLALAAATRMAHAARCGSYHLLHLFILAPHLKLVATPVTESMFFWRPFSLGLRTCPWRRGAFVT